MSLTEPFNGNVNYQERLSNEFRNIRNRLSFLSPKDDTSDKLSSSENDPITIKERYQIAISQDGKFAVTFDSANLRIRVLENTDYRQFRTKKQINATSKQIQNDEEINRTITSFKLNENLDIDKFYKEYPQKRNEPQEYDNAEDYMDKRFRWSLDISNVQVYDGKCFIFVAVSRIDVFEDMRGTKNNDTKFDYKKSTIKKRYERMSEDPPFSVPVFPMGNRRGTAVYRLKLIGENENYAYKECPVTYFYSGNVSGICKFVQDLDNTEQNSYTLKRFIVLNFNGIYNFEYDVDYRSLDLTERFNYPKSFEDELEHWHNLNLKDDCMDKLLACLYNQYFLVEQYKNNVQTLEVYDFAEMKLKTTPKRVEKKDKHVRRFNCNTFAIGKLQLCFTRGLSSIKLYFMENGLEVVSKKFDEIDKIYSLEFIDSDEKLFIIGEKKEQVKLMIWDIYTTAKPEPVILDNFSIVEFNDRLARTSGNILQVDDVGRVTSVLKKIENKLKQNQPEETYENFKIYTDKTLADKPDGKKDGNHTLHSEKIFKPIVVDKEPWVIGEYKRDSYCLYQYKDGTKSETLQLIVGRSTVQIWHQIQDDSKNKNDLPNMGGPFLEYIWANGIPINQEREATRLRIGEFKYKPIDGSLNDFYLKVYWYERVSNKKYGKNEEIIIEEEDKEIERMEINRNEGVEGEERIIEKKEKVIQRKDIIEKVSAVRRACRSLEHLNKRRSFLKTNYVKIHQYEEMIMYIKHIVWRFAKHKPEEFKLLDIRHNVMKNLILGDCSYLIKLILFGDKKKGDSNDENEDEKFIIRHIPRSVSWPGKTFIKDDDLRFENNNLEDHERINPENDMELAIYRYKGRELKDTVVVAYLLEYYSCHATEYAGWMSTVSKALPLLFKYNYDDYARKLFRKECFANQDYFSAQDPYNIIPKEYQTKRNHNIKFRAFRIDKLQSDEYQWYNGIGKLVEPFIKTFKFFEDFDNDIEKSPLALRVVPLPEFTINRIPQKTVDQNFRKKIILNALLFIFIPRLYKIGRNEKNLLSPFSRVVRYENNDDMYDNPATEAVIDFRWQKARNFFFFLFLRFLIFASCFICVSWEYLLHRNISERYRNFLVALIVILYYLAIYLLVTELIQLYYHGPRKYFGDIFNSFDIFSIALPVVVMSIMLQYFQFSNGFGSVIIVDTGLMVGISFSIFFLWIEFVLYLRLLSKIAIYIYYVIYIIKNIFPFLLFMFIVIIAFAHTMFILLKDPNNPKINIKSDSSTGNVINPVTNENLYNIQLDASFDPTDRNDNPFSSFPTSIMAAYFWMNGDMVQRDHFDFWVIDLFTLIASIFIVLVLQNMLIAFMGGVYERAETKGRQALLRFRANQIVDYEALHHIHFWPPEPEPKYIYYIGQSKNFQEWYHKRKDDQGEIYKDFEEKSTIAQHTFKDVDYDDDSIWKFDNDNSSNINDKKKEESIRVRSSIIETSNINDKKKEDFIKGRSSIIEKHTSSIPEGFSQEMIIQEINEIKKLRDNMTLFIDELRAKFNIQE
ncbi:hypothetical protein C1645_807927 [Glomus cerebriforme]|uniref:Ion transport domain-containing protein n=1 Tax=Glomus cerebriforme TaxID=658196 RepID=A0A397SQD8_9GLOM|nr:hypothetical protein C1645_807927 [Glomus cerebriforme]